VDLILREFDQYFLQKDEPVKSCLIALREIILKQDDQIKIAWKYGMPFFCIKGKMLCYLWIHKKHKQPYLGIVAGKYIIHPDLIMEKRSRMKIMLFDPTKDLPIRKIQLILNQTLALYRGQN